MRAALEGVACQLRWMLPHIEALTERRHDELVFAAGGARSDAWAQILADVCNRPVRQLAEPQLTNCRGAALLAFHRLGALDLAAAGEHLVERRRYEPRAEHRALYDDLAGRFVLAHERLGPVFGGARREEDEMTDTDPRRPRFGFDEKGLGAAAVIEELAAIARSEDGVWADGRCSGTIYCGDRAIYDLIAEAFGRFSYVNVLQRDMCPSQTRFESEIIAMTLDMLHGEAARARGLAPCGVIGSGGSESIISAIYAHREWGRAEKGIEAPEMILPETAHVAFDKGAHYFGVRVVRAPVDPVTTLVDVDFVREHIGRNTVLLVGSAGNYPYGTIDPIEELSELAVEHGIGLHVDGCLGGFILPWGEELGYAIPPFDFRLPGVTTISADTHKYGYGPKGTSVLLFRDKSLRRHQYFARPDWKGGMYASPGIGGSRSGGLIAATWAVMVALGRQGYLDKARRVFETAFAMQAEVTQAPGAAPHGQPDLLLLLHLRRVRHLPRQRLHEDARLALQRPAVPERDPHVRHRPADPARRGGALRRRPRGGRRLRAPPRPAHPAQRRPLRRPGHPRHGGRPRPGAPARAAHATTSTRRWSSRESPPRTYTGGGGTSRPDRGSPRARSRRSPGWRGARPDRRAPSGGSPSDGPPRGPRRTPARSSPRTRR